MAIKRLNRMRYNLLTSPITWQQTKEISALG